MENIRISVVVPIYRVEKYIGKCARSLFDQTIQNNIEFVFVDDCSPDRSITVLKKVISDYPNREGQIKIIRHKQNSGLAKSRNSAIDQALGDYIYIIDSDDWLLQNNALEMMLNVAEESKAEIIEANYCRVSNKYISKVELYRNYSSKKDIIKNIICKKNSITIWNKLIKKSLYDDNCIRVPDGINNGEDYVTLPKLMYFAQKVIKINLYSYAYNQMNINSFASNRTNWTNLDSMIDANRHLRDFFQEHDSKYLKFIERMYLETKAYHLLYSQSKEELSLVRNKFSECKSRYFFKIRWKFMVVLIFDALRINSMILQIGKIFRKRGYVNK